MMKVQFCAAGEKFGEILLKNKNLNLELEKNFKTIRTFAQNLGENVLKGGVLNSISVVLIKNRLRRA